MKKRSHNQLLLKHKKRGDDSRFDKSDDVRAIINALNNRKYKGRTVAGIAADINSSVSKVMLALNNDPKLIKTVKIYPRKSTTGAVLVTTRERFYKEASFLDKFVEVFATNRLAL